MDGEFMVGVAGLMHPPADPDDAQAEEIGWRLGERGDVVRHDAFIKVPVFVIGFAQKTGHVFGIRQMPRRYRGNGGVRTDIHRLEHRNVVSHRNSLESGFWHGGFQRGYNPSPFIRGNIVLIAAAG
jgi:hypothetical protein